MANTKKIEKQIIELQKKLKAEKEKDSIAVGEITVKELDVEDVVLYKKFLKKHGVEIKNAFARFAENERKTSEQKQQKVVSETQGHTENGMGA